MLYRRKNHGQSMLEFILLVVFILGAFLVFQKYIVRGFAGRWKGVGDSLGEGRIYDPQRTLECAYDDRYSFLWYDVKCFELSCEDDCFSVTGNAELCGNCINDCADGRCQPIGS